MPPLAAAPATAITDPDTFTAWCIAQGGAANRTSAYGASTTTVATTDEYGTASEVAVTQRVFDADAFTAAYGAQSGAANRAFRDLYGASRSTTSTSEAGGESTSYTVTHTSTTFADSGWVAEDGVMRHRDLLGLDLNTARLRDNGAVGFDARAGWVTSQANVDRGRSFFDRVTDALGSPPFGSGTLMPPGFTAQDPLSRAVLGGVQEQLQFPGQMVHNLITNAGRPWDALRGGGEAALAHLINQGARGLNEAVSLWDRVRGEYHERRLNADEIASLRRLYGDSIDYGAVRIQYGGSKESLGAEFGITVDNTIWMDSSMVDDRGNLTTRGQDLLMHEMGHVWQYQNRGPSYLGEALWSQLIRGRSARQSGAHQGLGTAYDWYTPASGGKRFEDMNPEQQAELAMYIGRSLGADGELDEARLRAMLVAELRSNGRDDDADNNDMLNRAISVAREARELLRNPR